MSIALTVISYWRRRSRFPISPLHYQQGEEG
jgi:hypothetical protein